MIGQFKLGRAGQYCLSQEGSEAGVEDAAEKAAIVASNSADVQAHGASMAVDGRSSTFWARLHLVSVIHSHVGVLRGERKHMPTVS